MNQYEAEAHDEELAELRAKIESVTSERDAARAEAIELRIEANLPEPWPFTWEDYGGRSKAEKKPIRYGHIARVDTPPHPEMRLQACAREGCENVGQVFGKNENPFCSVVCAGVGVMDDGMRKALAKIRETEES